MNLPDSQKLSASAGSFPNCCASGGCSSMSRSLPLLLYALGLALPIFFQLVIDKVLVHESYTTLYVLAVGAAVALVFDAIFSFLRRYLLLYATNRIDIRVATKTFGHLLGLPIAFFEHISAGVLVKHMQQAARIREFLTGRLFLTMLDALSLFVFLPVLALYSVKLTCVVLGFTALSGIVVVLLVGPFRRRLYALYQAEGARQALLVETVHGMRRSSRWRWSRCSGRVWDDRCAQSISHALRRREDLGRRAVHDRAAREADDARDHRARRARRLQRRDDDRRAGRLQHARRPGFRAAGPDGHHGSRIPGSRACGADAGRGDEPEARAGRRSATGLRPELHGQDRVRERIVPLRPGRRAGARRCFVHDPAGQGVRHRRQERLGQDDADAADRRALPGPAGAAADRRLSMRANSIWCICAGISALVLQDNFLFRGTVRDNIACVKPEATFEEVVQAAQLAGADEFIERLPRGFDTMLEENASNLSGGQKQRLAIARALITNPRILILDEATSALDSESEMIIRRNLRRIAEGRTVIIVSHRLSMLVGCRRDPGDRPRPHRRRRPSRQACCRSARSIAISGTSRRGRSHDERRQTTGSHEQRTCASTESR